MFTYLSRRGTRPRTTTRLPRLPAALAGPAGGGLAWAGAVPAASASIIPVPGDGPYGPAPAPAAGMIAAGGMPGGQTPLTAAAAALAAPTAAVVLDRARASRRTVSSTG